MTWTAHCTVQDVGDGPAPIDVLASANAGDKVTPYSPDQQLDAVVSNTEGPIRAVELRLQIDADTTSVKVGDVITVNGHFQG